MPQIDFQSQTWLALREKLTADLEELRLKLESPLLDHPATQLVRGEIARVRVMMALADAPPEITHDPNY